MNKWQDVPDVSEREERAPKGTFLNAHLISPYFRIENTKTDGSKWLIPVRSAKLAKLRQRLADARRRWGSVEQSGLVDRPNAGQRLVGPLPAGPGRGAQRLLCDKAHKVSADFTIPADQLVIPGLTWSFRLKANRCPIPVPETLYYFAPGKEAR